MHRHHRLAMLVIAGALVLDVTFGLAYSAVTPHLSPLHGIYCAIANAVTVGGDVPPASAAGYVIQAAECLVIVPLFGATFSLLTSGLLAGHVERAEDRIRKHIERTAGNEPQS